jgi:hypothetical protein
MDACLARVAESLRETFPGIGADVAIDASDLPAYGNGQRHVFHGGPEREKFSDPDASWGHRSAVGTRTGGGFYGYKIDAAVCSLTGLPLAWQVRTARRNDSMFVAPLIDAVKARGYQPETVAMDRGYDNNRVFAETQERGCVPIIALRKGRPIPLTTIPYGSPEWKASTTAASPSSASSDASSTSTRSPRCASVASPVSSFTPTSASSRDSRSRSRGHEPYRIAA